MVQKLLLPVVTTLIKPPSNRRPDSWAKTVLMSADFAIIIDNCYNLLALLLPGVDRCCHSAMDVFFHRRRIFCYTGTPDLAAVVLVSTYVPDYQRDRVAVPGL